MRGSRNGPSFSCPRPFPARLFIFRSGAPPPPSAHHFACPALSRHPVRCPLNTAHLRSTEKLERCAPYESPSSPTCTCPAHALVSLGAALLALARAGLGTRTKRDAAASRASCAHPRSKRQGRPATTRPCAPRRRPLGRSAVSQAPFRSLPRGRQPETRVCRAVQVGSIDKDAESSSLMPSLLSPAPSGLAVVAPAVPSRIRNFYFRHQIWRRILTLQKKVSLVQIIFGGKKSSLVSQALSLARILGPVAST